jgi:hypothetical protein
MYRGKDEQDAYLGHKRATSYRSNKAPFCPYRSSLLAVGGTDEEDGNILVRYITCRPFVIIIIGKKRLKRREKCTAIKIAETLDILINNDES